MDDVTDSSDDDVDDMIVEWCLGAAFEESRLEARGGLVATAAMGLLVPFSPTMIEAQVWAGK